MSLEITIGDKVVIDFTAKINGATFPINLTATIKAAIISANKKSILLPTITVPSTNNGADWPNSLVTIIFDETETSDISYTGKAFIEVQIDDSGPSTWYIPINLVKGLIV